MILDKNSLVNTIDNLNESWFYDRIIDSYGLKK